MIEIVKNQLDVGLVSARQELVDFWRDDAGLVFDHSIPVMKGQVQWRFVERGSVVKVNIRKELSGTQRSGIELVSIARDDLEAPKEMADPDGNRVRFVPTGTDGVRQLGVQLAVRNLAGRLLTTEMCWALIRSPRHGFDVVTRSFSSRNVPTRRANSEWHSRAGFI